MQFYQTLVRKSIKSSVERDLSSSLEKQDVL